MRTALLTLATIVLLVGSAHADPVVEEAHCSGTGADRICTRSVTCTPFCSSVVNVIESGGASCSESGSGGAWILIAERQTDSDPAPVCQWQVNEGGGGFGSAVARIDSSDGLPVTLLEFTVD